MGSEPGGNHCSARVEDGHHCKQRNKHWPPPGDVDTRDERNEVGDNEGRDGRQDFRVRRRDGQNNTGELYGLDEALVGHHGSSAIGGRLLPKLKDEQPDCQEDQEVLYSAVRLKDESKHEVVHSDAQRRVEQMP